MKHQSFCWDKCFAPLSWPHHCPAEARFSFEARSHDRIKIIDKELYLLL